MATPAPGYGVFMGLQLDNDANVRTRAARFQAVWQAVTAGAETARVDIIATLGGVEAFLAIFADSTLVILPQTLDAALQLSSPGFSASGGLLSYVSGTNAGFVMSAAFGDMNGGLNLLDGGLWLTPGNHAPPSGIGSGSSEYGIKIRGIGLANHFALDRQTDNANDDSIFLDGWNVRTVSGSTTARHGQAMVCTGTITITLPPQLLNSIGGDLTIGNRVLVRNNGTGVVTVSGAGDTIDGQTTRLVLPGQARTYFMTAATTWLTEDEVRPNSTPSVVTTTKTATYSAHFGETVPVNPSGGDFTVNIPAVTSADVGDVIRITHTSGSGKVTVDASGSDEISKEGTSSTTKVVKKGESFDFQAVASSGTIRWFVV